MPILKLDTVQGHEVLDGFRQGSIIRTAHVQFEPAELNPWGGGIGSPTVLTRAINLPGLPNKGDPYPDTKYSDYFLKTYRARPDSAVSIRLEMVYEYRGQIIIRDTSSLSIVEAQVHPSTLEPMYVTWINPKDNKNERIVKLCNLKGPLPTRHFSIQQTISYEASSAVLLAYGSVNSINWHGLPKGYWLFSGLDASSDDDGLTWTYQVVWSTQQIMDWSQYEYMTNDRGIPFLSDSDENRAALKALRLKPYVYGVDTSLNGVTKAGMYPLCDFRSLFGVN